jgi:uridine kinase
VVSSVYVSTKKLIKLPLFVGVLVAKLVAAYFFASSYATTLFIPFVTFFAAHGGANPYDYFYTHGVSNAFPYSGLMLFLLSVPYVIFHAVSEAVTYADILLLRLPLLVADFGILVIFLSWFKTKQKEVLWLYWANPILLYITYIHGQLDVVPVFFLFAFLYFLFKEKDALAFILLGCAIATKTGMLIVLPFVALYLIKERKNIVAVPLLLSIPFITFFILNIPYAHSVGFVEMVLKTKQQLKVFDLVVQYNQSLVLFIVPVALGVLLFKFFTFKKYSRDLFMVFLGFSFFVLTLCIPPMQGWYFWVIPFAVYFYIKASVQERLLLYALYAAYFIYFAVIQESDYFSVFSVTSPSIASLPNIYTYGLTHGMNVDFLVNASFTLLQTTLLITIYFIYRKGIEEYTKYKIHYKPFLIGVAGDSGSGKSTFAELMEHIFGDRNVSVIAGDDMHKWERGNEMWSTYTHLDPLANELHTDIKHIYAIKEGNPIKRRHYDHSTGTFTEPKTYEPRRLVIFEGLHAFFLDTVRKAFDLKVYIAPEDQVRLHWKIVRDARDRGYTKEKTLEILDKRKDDSERFIAVQEKHSDIIISLRNDVSLGRRVGDEDVVLSLSLFITCANDIFLEPLLDELAKYFSIDYLIHDEKQRVKFTGTILAYQIQRIADKLLPELDEITDEKRLWKDDYQGVMQLFVIYYMFEQMKLEKYGH